ncbi:cupin domain-containing protein [Rhizobium sp. BK251]|uniref:cupin domain-containing protein n=1 Tax=Rhizobium sp. BK251 TaxID=2512125 RepID=UPI00104A2B01|nr:cupin domain-containing protein [Rhizobium sp. BK251]TCL67204.1 cupin domain [Rhizobium sp. BK251]
MTNNSDWFDARPGEHCLIRVPAADTNGAYSIVEIVSDPLDGTPMHIHQNEDECIFVLEGMARLAYGDLIIDATAGESIMLKRGIPHAWCNPSDSPLHMMIVCTPGGIEEALRIVSRGGDIDLTALGQRFGVRIIGPGILEPAP